MLEKKVIEISNALYKKHATVYADSSATPRACILYFHGGGLLYGERDDLPKLHIDTLTGAGYIIISYDYPLAPAAKLNTILDDVSSSISHYVECSDMYGGSELPFFLWGRSAGAYLCLLAAAQGDLPTAPKGILSYYGYGFLCDGWFEAPSSFYCSLPLWKPPAWTTRGQGSRLLEAWTRITASMSMQGRPAGGGRCCTKGARNTSIWTIPCVHAPLCPVRCSVPTARTTRMYHMKNSWRLRAAMPQNSLSRPAAPTISTGSRTIRLRRAFSKRR